MGSSDIARLDLGTFTLSWFRGVGLSPRHVVLDPTGRYLYATLNGDSRVIKIDTTTGNGHRAGRHRLAAAEHGDLVRRDRALRRQLRVELVTKLRASDMSIVQTVDVPSHPIGITFEPATHRVWVACYSGEILVFDA